MRVVYEPENLIDAHLVKGLLEQDGIPVYLRGEHLAGGIGELPAFGLFALCVPESCEAQAREVLEQLRCHRSCAVEAGQNDALDGALDGWDGVAA